MSNWPEWNSPCGRVRLINADCLDVLPTLGKVISCTVTSPPYNQRIDAFRASGFKAEGNAQWASRIASSYSDSMPEPEYQQWQHDVLNLVYYASKDSASIFYNHKCRWRDRSLLHPLDIVRKTEWKVRQEIIWLRDGSLTQNAKMFPPCEERIIWAHNGQWKWNASSNRFMSVWRIDSEKWSDHPVAFPEELPSRAIEATTDHGDIVLDPFCGSATTGVAAVRLGRRFIGIEIEPKYFEIAVNKIKDAIGMEVTRNGVTQKRMFVPGGDA